jgi:hypothetical protein
MQERALVHRRVQRPGSLAQDVSLIVDFVDRRTHRIGIGVRLENVEQPAHPIRVRDVVSRHEDEYIAGRDRGQRINVATQSLIVFIAPHYDSMLARIRGCPSGREFQAAIRRRVVGNDDFAGHRLRDRTFQRLQNGSLHSIRQKKNTDLAMSFGHCTTSLEANHRGRRAGWIPPDHVLARRYFVRRVQLLSRKPST